MRWINYLRPDLKRGSFTEQEERIIIDVHRILGNRWAQIAKHLPGRTDNEVKNFWNSVIKKKLISQGLDPNTHNLQISTPTLHHHKNRTKSHLHPSPNNNNISSSSSSSPPSVFTVDTSPCKEIVETNASNLLPPLPPVPLVINNATFQFQNPNVTTTTWTTTDPHQLYPALLMEFSSCSSTSSMTPSFAPPAFGVITTTTTTTTTAHDHDHDDDDQNCMWPGFDDNPQQPSTITTTHIGVAQELEMRQEQGGGGGGGGQPLNFMNAFDDSANNISIDFEFMDSAAIYSNVMNSMDHLAWDC